MTQVYDKTAAWPLSAVLLAVVMAGCAASSGARSAADTGWHPNREPADTTDAFITAWNQRDRFVLLGLFDEDRRSIIDEAPEFDVRLRDWEAVEASISSQCNARGAYFKTAVITYRDRRSGAPIEEIVWLHLKSGGWWMYSL